MVIDKKKKTLLRDLFNYLYKQIVHKLQLLVLVSPETSRTSCYPFNNELVKAQIRLTQQEFDYHVAKYVYRIDRIT